MNRFFRKLIIAWLLFLSGNCIAETLIVSAASSLSDAFKEIASEFEKKHTGSHIVLNFAASGVLAQQIIQGAPVDIFAAADQESMDRVEAKKAIHKNTRINFVSNRLVLITPKDSKLTSPTLKALMDNHITHIVIGNPLTTPAGRYAKAALEQAGIWDNIQPKLVLADSARQSLGYVSRGEVSAGVAFYTDALQYQEKIIIAFPIPTVKEGNTKGQWVTSPASYPIAQVAQSKNTLAKEFISFVCSGEGQAILIKYGFEPFK